MEQFIKSTVQDGELKMYSLLRNIFDLNDKFEKLYIPEVLEINKTAKQLVLTHYSGKTYDNLWNTSTGGSLMKKELAQELVLVLKDLNSIPLDIIPSNDIDNFEFQYQKHSEYFYNIASQYFPENDKVKSIIFHRQSSAKILNNGDFYPRNIIRHNDNLVLIDWETFNPHAPFFMLDHVENVAAVVYVHMWNNAEWQKLFIKSLKQHFDFSNEDFLKGIIIKALTLAHFFPKEKIMKEGQLRIIRKALEGELKL